VSSLVVAKGQHVSRCQQYELTVILKVSLEDLHNYTEKLTSVTYTFANDIFKT